MASSACCQNGLERILPIVLIFICSLVLSSSNSVGLSPFLRGSDHIKGVKQMNMVLGSRPPQCINRCFNCRPCMAALVSPPHHKTSSSGGDESYYLLGWKCKCGDRYFQP